MGIIGFIKRIFDKSIQCDDNIDKFFEVEYTIWVGDPMCSTYPVDKYAYVPKNIIDDDMTYITAEKKVYEYIRDEYTCGLGMQLTEFHKNEYINRLFIISEEFDKICPVSKAYNVMKTDIKRR